MTVTTDTFTGSNGAGPPSPWVAVTLSGTQNIQSNKWRIVNGTTYAGTAMTRGATSYTAVDVTAEITLDATGAEQYPAIGARLAGGTNGWASFAEGYNGYVAYLNPIPDEIHISKQTSGASVNDQSASMTLTAGTTYKLRFQLIGSTIRCRAWDIGTGEPGTWDVTMTDSTYTSGLVGFRDQSPSNIVTSDWDNFVIDDAPGGGGGVQGTAAADFVLTAAGVGTRSAVTGAQTVLTFDNHLEGAGLGSNFGGPAVVAAMAGR